MKIIRKTEQLTDWDKIREMIRDRAFRQGDEIEIEGAMWRVLDVWDKEIFVWKHTGIEEESVFNKNGSNKYEGSDLQKYLQGDYMDRIPQEMKDLMSADGLYPLSIEEVRHYLPKEGDRIATDNDGDTVWHSLRSAYRGSACYVWNVDASGSVTSSGATFAYRCAPACHLVID